MGNVSKPSFGPKSQPVLNVTKVAEVEYIVLIMMRAQRAAGTSLGVLTNHFSTT
jgi:hypothetical protein